MKLLKILTILLSMSLFLSNAIVETGELSGITWCPKTNQFIVVGDEGILFAFDENLNFLDSSFIGKFDFEGISYCSTSETLFCLDEKTLNLIEVRCDDLRIIDIHRLDMNNRHKYTQFESLVFTGETSAYANRFFTVGTRDSRKNKGATIFYFTLDNMSLEPLLDIPMRDISGMTVKENSLILISDSADEIYFFDLETLTYETRDLPGKHQEGIIYKESMGFIIADESEELFFLNE